jgi:hypothetical protein
MVMLGGDENSQGQPQCRKKVKTVGFPFELGKGSFEDEGAFEPTSGAIDISRALGVRQEWYSCWKVIAAG